MARIPPMSRKTTAATAFPFVRASACWWNTSPVLGQVRNIRFTAMAPPLLDDVEAAHHRVMVDAAVFVADDRVGAGLGRRDGEHVVVARVHLDVDVLGLQ